MSTLIERMQEVMRAKSWGVEHVAKVAGVSESAVYQWLGKGSKTIHSIGKIEAATKLEKASGFSALWIAKGKGRKHVDSSAGDSVPDDQQPAQVAGVRAALAILEADLAAIAPLLQSNARATLVRWATREASADETAATIEALVGATNALPAALPTQGKGEAESATPAPVKSSGNNPYVVEKRGDAVWISKRKPASAEQKTRSKSN